MSLNTISLAISWRGGFHKVLSDFDEIEGSAFAEYRGLSKPF